MKNFYLFILLTINLHAQTLKLDQNFGANGIVSFDKIEWSPDVTTPKILPINGSLYLVHGIRISPGSNRIALIKMNEKGKLDPFYFNQGVNILSFNIDTVEDYKTLLTKLQLLSTTDNQILLSCGLRNLVSKKLAQLIIKFDLNGIIDTTFGKKGLLIIKNENPIFTSQTKLIADSSNQIYIQSFFQDTSTKLYHIELSKYSYNGIKDINFGINGFVSLYQIEPTHSPKFFLDPQSNIYISYTNQMDSFSFIRSYNNHGKIRLGFGNNGIFQMAKITGQNTPYIDLIVFHSDFIYLKSELGYIESAIITKIDTNAIVDFSFGNNGYVTIDDSKKYHTVHSFNKYLVCFRPIDSGPLHSLLLNYNGRPILGSTYEWVLSFDSIPINIYEDQYSEFADELYIIGKSKAPSANPRNLLLLKFKLDLTTTTQNAEPNELDCFPNPFTNTIQIKDLYSNWPFLYIIDCLGRTILQKELKTESDRVLETSNWDNGIYNFILQDKSRLKQYVFKRVHIQN
ncbi:MAG: hypothetical protein JNL65_01910 [Saprospiraceae bacterium]|nr:hypothetical protein [Saprospiraceae bacterium]